MDLDDENDAAVRLVAAARKALIGGGVTELTYTRLAKAATAAVLRELVDVMNEDDTDEEWPGPDDLELLADEIEGVEP